MNNSMKIEDHIALISFDPELNQFRGEFTGLNGGADFYAESVEELKKEGAASLKTFLEVCKERGIDPYGKPPGPSFSGQFSVPVPANLHSHLTEAANAAGLRLNQWVQQTLEHKTRPNN
uniref:Predicted nuclease of the RNAse H fold, HicB family n=1 Tax=Candidatus Kentrum sp. TUN TaxID=2126343 RepID=A0A450ZRU5_9GAMM|nr:MAG: Predicted nuclease of the RNAse H fold, HicB family [Candidatus Kentron sp. TUN]VFK62772.1 MAG: Predicted nuclease of the RNAse H fold, HicB family [Candidatus Kentron sp. TUN]